jgi:t-SNARE complex subunit (syntaxin)
MAGINRLNELRLGVGDVIDEADTTTQNANADINEYAKLYEPIKRNLEAITRNVEQIKQLKEKDKNIANEKSRKEIMDRLDKIMSETTRKAREIKNDLDDIDTRNKKYSEDHKNTATAQARRNMYDAHMRRLNKIMTEYNTASHEFKHDLQERTRRQLKIVNTDITDDQIEKIVSSGQANGVIAQFLISENLQEVVRDIEERHLDILKLERQVLEVYELFKDLATLVDYQQESLEVIDHRIAQSKAYVQNGEIQLQQAATYQQKARRKRVCLLVLLLVILVIMVVGIMIPQLNKG